MKTIRQMGLMRLMIMLALLALATTVSAQEAPAAAGSALPYLDQALKVNEALLGLPSLPLVLLGALALGYFLKFIPPYKNEWIPFGVVVGALLANVGIVITEGSGDYIRAVILGLVAGVASIAVHRKWLKDWLDPKIFGVGLLVASVGIAGCTLPFADQVITMKQVGDEISREYAALWKRGLITAEQDAKAEKIHADYRAAMAALALTLETAAQTGNQADVPAKLRAAKSAIAPLLDMITPLLGTPTRGPTLARDLNLAVAQ